MRANNRNIFVEIDSAGGDYVTSGDFNTATGDVTLTRLSGGTVVYNLDNRYSLTGHTHDISEITGFTQTDDYLTGHTFNTSTGLFESALQSGSTISVNLDGRYLHLSATTAQAALIYSPTGNTTGIIKSGRTEANYGPVGSGAFDLSNSFLPSSTVGATGSNSFALNFQTTASGQGSTASGFKAIASGSYSTASGYETIASGDYSTAFGRSTTANVNDSTAWGVGTTASGLYSTAWGQNTTASGDRSTAWGRDATATIGYATAWGRNTTASAGAATAWGRFTTASGSYSTAWGYNNTAPSYGETNIGLFSTTGNTVGQQFSWDGADRIFNVGNGTGVGSRSDALTILKFGDVIAPSLSIGIINSSDARVLITKEYADANYSGGTNTDDYVTGHTFNTSTGLFESTLQSGSTVSVNLDGRYSLTGHTHVEYLTGYTDTNDYVTGGTFNTGTGNLTLTRLSGGTVVTNLDNRYSVTGHTHSQYLTGFTQTDDYVTGSTFNTGTGDLTLIRLSGGTIVTNLDDRYSLTGHTHDISEISGYTDTFVTGHTFNTATGLFESTLQSGGTVSVNLDGRYLQITGSTGDDYLTGGTFNDLTGDLTLDLLSGNTVNVNLDGRYLTGFTESPSQAALIFSPTGNTTGIIKSGRTEANYGPVGIRAIDLTNSLTASATRGATGQESMAWGRNTTASGDYSTTWGSNTTASGDTTTAWGRSNLAGGDWSTAWGQGNRVLSIGETALGLYGSEVSGNGTTWVGADRIFNVGNGINTGLRSDALTILKYGDVIAPSLSIGIINSADTRVLITKEYADANYSGGTGGTGSGITWTAVTSNTTCSFDTGYIANSGSLITFTLPVSNNLKTIRVTGKGTGGWQVDVPSGWTINFASIAVTDNLQSNDSSDSIELLGLGDDEYQVISSIGNITFNNL